MSLYIGKDINNEPLLHLTSDQRTEQELKSDVPIPSTLFHSSLPYISVVDIFGEGPQNYAGQMYNGQLLSDRYFYSMEVDEAKLNEYLNKGYYISLVSSRAGLFSRVPKIVSSSSQRALMMPAFPATGAIRSVTGSVQYPTADRAMLSLQHFSNRRSSDMGVSIGGTGVPAMVTYLMMGNGKAYGASGGMMVGYGGDGGPTGIGVYGYPYRNGNQIGNVTIRNQYTTWASMGAGNSTVWVNDVIGPPPAQFHWDPENSGKNPNITYPTKLGGLSRVIVYNLRQDENGNLVAGKSLSTDKSIYIDRNDIIVGDFSIKDGIFLVEDDGNSQPRSSILQNTKKWNIFNELAYDTRKLDVPLMFNGRLEVTLPTSEGSYSYLGSKEWTTYGVTEYKPATISARRMLKDGPVTLEFNNKEIKYKDNSSEKVIASANNGAYTPLTLGASDAITASFPAWTKNYLQLRQGATWYQSVPSLTSNYTLHDPSAWGRWGRTEIVAAQPLPAKATAGDFLFCVLTEPRIKGAALVADGVSTTQMNIDCDVSTGAKLIDPVVFRRTDAVPFTVASILLSCQRNMQMNGNGYPTSGSAADNRAQSVLVRYLLQVNWAESLLELVAEYSMANVNTSWSVGDYWCAVRSMGETEVTYSMPEIKIGAYVAGYTD